VNSEQYQLPAGWVRLKSRREVSVQRGHPWVFSGAIQASSPGLVAGSVVRIEQNDGRCLGVGLYGTGSIAVKLLAFRDVPIDEALFGEKFGRALAVRRALGLWGSPHTTGFRLVHAEGDGLPGVIVDWYAGAAVVQLQTEGLVPFTGAIASALRQVLGDRLQDLCVVSTDAAGVEHRTMVVGDRKSGDFMENDAWYRAHWMTGQKTGFFLDQRENRLAIRSLMPTSGTMLNLFCYTGGFSIAGLKGGASRVVSVDSSEIALEQFQEHLQLNGFSANSAPAVRADCFDYLDSDTDLYDVVVCDPPAFAKHQKAVDRALRGYRRANAAALRRVKAGGLFATFSCSQAVSIDAFRSVVQAAFDDVGRRGRIIKNCSQAPCHPVAISHPEGEYLKGLCIIVD
jgi:23S rRNA (cytosine1962-C5)-methyltransferase